MKCITRGLLMGFSCFCLGYIAHDFVGQVKVSPVGSAFAAFIGPVPVTPSAPPLLVHAPFESAGSWRALAEDKTFACAVVWVAIDDRTIDYIELTRELGC